MPPVGKAAPLMQASRASDMAPCRSAFTASCEGHETPQPPDLLACTVQDRLYGPKKTRHLSALAASYLTSPPEARELGVETHPWHLVGSNGTMFDVKKNKMEVENPCHLSRNWSFFSSTLAFGTEGPPSHEDARTCQDAPRAPVALA